MASPPPAPPAAPPLRGGAERFFRFADGSGDFESCRPLGGGVAVVAARELKSDTALLELVARAWVSGPGARGTGSSGEGRHRPGDRGSGGGTGASDSLGFAGWVVGPRMGTLEVGAVGSVSRACAPDVGGANQS